MHYQNKIYKSKFGNRTYVQYHDEERDQTYTNAEYYVLDLQNEDLKEELNHIGGFCANIMFRELNQRGITGIEKIMFACTPKETNQFEFLILYLGLNDEIKLILCGNTYFDWKYFKNKFKMAVIKEGFIYDLEGEDNFKSLRDSYVNESSKSFGLNIGGIEIEYDHILLLNDISVIKLKDDIQNSIDTLKSTSALLRFYTDSMTGTNLEICFIDKNDSLISRYQMNDPNAVREEYVERLLNKLMLEHDENLSIFNIAFNNLLNERMQPEWIRFIPVSSLIKWSQRGILSLLSQDKYQKYLDDNLLKYKYLLR